MINVFGTSDWALRITSIISEFKFKQYDTKNYDTANSKYSWVIANQSGLSRKAIAESELLNINFTAIISQTSHFFGTDFGDGSILDFNSVIRPLTTVGKFTYIGACTNIDIKCNIGSYVNIGDNVSIGKNVTIEDYVVIDSNTNISDNSIITI